MLALLARFCPDLYPVADLPEQDIIGEIRELASIVDGTGGEVGRFVELGLVADSFKALTQLAVRIHEIEALRETMRLEFIQDAAFEWVHTEIRLLELCATYVLKKAEQS